MNFNKTYISKTAVFVLFALTMIIFSSLYLASCTDRVKNEKTPNQSPEVYFVNIPPNGQKQSFNDVIYWYGTDKDGQIELFRYIVIESRYIDTLVGESPQSLALILANKSRTDSFVVMDNDTIRWHYLDVSINDPQTQDVIEMSASLDDPVETFVPQYVFLQAFDDLGASSNVPFKIFLRNDFPPDTEIRGIDPRKDYINAPEEGGVNTGVPIRWEGSDPDVEDTLFEYQWKLFGPFESDTSNGSVYEALIDSFVKDVFVTNTAKVYPVGIDTFFIVTDSSYECSTLTMGGETCYVEVTTDTVFVDDLDPETPEDFGIYGQFDVILDINDPEFYNFIGRDSATQSSGGWTKDSSTVLYDIYPEVTDPAADTTRQEKFIFWARSRDAASVVDLTPAYVSFTCIQPKFERDVLVIDLSKIRGRVNAPVRGVNIYTPDTAVAYWYRAMHEWWNPNTDFDTTQLGTGIVGKIGQYRDYIYSNKQGDRVALKELLQHKVVVLYHDDVLKAGLSGGTDPSLVAANVYIAMEAGVNVWLTARSPIVGDNGQPANFMVVPDADYSEHFGVADMVNSSWAYQSMAYFLFPRDDPSWRPHRRIEDFIGALALKDPETRWVDLPDLTIDTAQMHRRLNWSDDFPIWGTLYTWDDTLPLTDEDPTIFKPANLHALPEVDWASRIYGTEVMYLYKSYYGPNHPLGFNFSFEGSPVAHSLNRGLYRSVHFSFTPLSIADDSMKVVLKDVLDYLYDADLSQPVSSIRYPESKVKVNIAQARNKYWREFFDDIDDKDLEKAVDSRTASKIKK